MGQEFLKSSLDTLSGLDLSTDILGLHSPERDRMGMRTSALHSRAGEGANGQDHAHGLDQMLSSVNMQHTNINKGSGRQRQSLHTESLDFMKGVMDECTHIANFSGENWQIPIELGPKKCCSCAVELV